MFNQLVEMLNQMTSQDVTKLPNPRIVIMLRDELVNLGNIDQSTANKMVMQAQINVSGEYTDEELHMLVDPTAIIIDKMAQLFFANGFSIEDIVLAGKDFSLTLEG